MRIVVQRVKEARVIRKDDEVTVGKIKKGYFALVGFKKGDTNHDVNYLSNKLAKLRVMSDYFGKMNKTIKETASSLLVVSQFTLYADTNGGNRPSFIAAEDPKVAYVLYERFVKNLKDSGLKVETGSFGDYMEITAVLDGPVTIIIDSDENKKDI